MRLIPALCWAARFATAAQIYTYDPESSLPGDDDAEGRSKTLSPVEARLVLAQRAGVEDYHVADLLRPGGMDAINHFGTKQPLFHSEAHTRRRVQILVEVEEDEGLSSIHARDTSHIAISPNPSALSTQSLFLDVTRQRWPGTFAPELSDSEMLAVLGKATAAQNEAGMELDDTSFHVRKPSMGEFERFWQDLITLAHEREARTDGAFAYSLTAVVIPSPSTEKSTSKGDKTIWGYYTMPDYEPYTLQKRQQETPLEEEPSSSSSPISPLQNENAASPLPGILPACFSTRRACQEQTRNCTGHGTCRLAYTDESQEEANREACYACQCVPTLLNSTDDAGNRRSQTIVWGGPACQKRDVSTSFWLIAGLTVGMVGLVSFAVGSLMGCGEEMLPSVIGAGVSGPGARR